MHAGKLRGRLINTRELNSKKLQIKEGKNKSIIIREQNPMHKEQNTWLD